MLSPSEFDLGSDRARIGWWLFVAALGAAATFLLYSFVGMVSLGVFGYYATRPIYDRIDGYIGSDRVAAGLTVAAVIVPVVLLALYAGFRVVQQAHLLFGDGGGVAGILNQFLRLDSLTPGQRQSLSAVLQNPQQLLSNPQQTLQTVLGAGLSAVQAIAGAVVLIGLSIGLSYFLLEHDDEFADALVDLFGGRDTAAYAYATAVDRDLESVWFGNLLFALVMAVVAAAAYWATNALAPAGVTIPMVPVLALLTGIASLIPIVVGKVVYLPVVGWLAYQTTQAQGASLAFVGGVLVAYFLLLDILPQGVLQPYVTGRKLDAMLLLFGYLLGPILFGWYGFFFLPILFVVMLEAIRIVLPNLVHGDRLTPDVSLGEGVSASPATDRGEPTPDEPAADDDPATEG